MNQTDLIVHYELIENVGIPVDMLAESLIAWEKAFEISQRLDNAGKKGTISGFKVIAVKEGSAEFHLGVSHLQLALPLAKSCIASLTDKLKETVDGWGHESVTTTTTTTYKFSKGLFKGITNPLIHRYVSAISGIDPHTGVKLVEINQENIQAFEEHLKDIPETLPSDADEERGSAIMLDAELHGIDWDDNSCKISTDESNKRYKAFIKDVSFLKARVSPLQQIHAQAVPVFKPSKYGEKEIKHFEILEIYEQPVLPR